MPVKRRYNYRKRAYGKKKYNRRNFSRFNTYRHRSAKAQAYQIYKLNKKINYINKKNSPDIHSWQTEFLTNSFQGTNSLHATQLNVFTGSRDGFYDGDFNANTKVMDNVDDHFNLRRVKFWGTVHKELNSPGSPDQYGFNGPMYVRLAVVQARGSAVLDANNYLGVPDDPSLSAIFGPVHRGFIKDWVILYDHIYKSCNNDTYMFNFKISVKPKYRIIQQFKAVLSSASALEHQMYLIALCYYDTPDETGGSTSYVNMEYCYKLYYTDT